jgi:hypothetical protein
MKIIGGNFGIEGSAWISRDNKLVVEGAQKGIYSPEQVITVSAKVIKEKKFGVLGFIVGAVILSIILGIFLNVLGVVVGVAVAVAGSFYSEKTNVVEVKFSDDKTVLLECTPRGARKLVQFAP